MQAALYKCTACLFHFIPESNAKLVTRMKAPDEHTIKHWLTPRIAKHDTAHDLQHVMRVVERARDIGQAEGADLNILIPAAWLHDLIVLPKNSAERSQAASRSAEQAAAWLLSQGTHRATVDAISHCIAAHSFSGEVQARTKEAKILQDADRLDALGAIGIARCFVTGASFGAAFYHPEMPITDGNSRSFNDKHYTLDHFYTKLYKLPERMHTQTAREIALQRLSFMKKFEQQLIGEIAGKNDMQHPA